MERTGRQLKSCHILRCQQIKNLLDGKCDQAANVKKTFCPRRTISPGFKAAAVLATAAPLTNVSPPNPSK
jgi:hypothetical protein